jgi:aspartyl-tRNA synthetase
MPLSKNELKKRAKAEEKERKAAEKAARQQELAQKQAEAEVVCIPSFK